MRGPLTQNNAKRKGLGRGLDALLRRTSRPRRPAPRATMLCPIERSSSPTDPAPRSLRRGAARGAGRLDPRAGRGAAAAGATGARTATSCMVAGERRWRAAQKRRACARSRWSSAASPICQAFEPALVENLQRERPEPDRGGRGLPGAPGEVRSLPGGHRHAGRQGAHDRHQLPPASPSARGGAGAAARGAVDGRTGPAAPGAAQPRGPDHAGGPRRARRPDRPRSGAPVVPAKPRAESPSKKPRPVEVNTAAAEEKLSPPPDEGRDQGGKRRRRCRSISIPEELMRLYDILVERGRPDDLQERQRWQARAISTVSSTAEAMWRGSCGSIPKFGRRQVQRQGDLERRPDRGRRGRGGGRSARRAGFCLRHGPQFSTIRAAREVRGIGPGRGLADMDRRRW